MGLPMAAWRVTYTPGDWVVLSGPTMLVAMLPAPPRMSRLVNALWESVVGARSVGALIDLFSEYGLDGMPALAAFFWDENGLHAMVRGGIAVVDADTGETAVTGADVVTWREEALGSTRRLRVDLEPGGHDEQLQLPLLVGAVTASMIHLTTDPASHVLFPDSDRPDVVPKVPMLGARQAPEGPGPEAEPADGEDTSAGAQEEAVPEAKPEPEPALEPEPDAVGTQELHFDADEQQPPSSMVRPDPPAPPVFAAPAVDPPSTLAVPPPASAPVVVPGKFQADNDDGGTVFSTGLAATHKPPAAAPEEQLQVLAVPCARGHANPAGSRTCRLCSAPVDSSNPRLINRPALAGVHSNKGEFADLEVAVLVGRSPDSSKAPHGAHLMRVSSPSSDISRNHLIVTPREWSVIVKDLNSTNGTTVVPVGEQPFVLANGESVQVDLGTVLDLGDGVSLRIEPPRG